MVRDVDYRDPGGAHVSDDFEEPPDFASIFLLTDNPWALLPTIRSRCMHLRLSALPTEAVDEYLANRRTDLKPKERALVARLSGGALGRAKGFDLAQYLTARQDALALVGPALGENEHSELFRVTDSSRAGADGKETKGLPAEIIAANPDTAITIPMPANAVRSLNLSTSAGIVLYEALRQTGRIA